MTGPRRNDPHFAGFNEGRYRRKLVNLPVEWTHPLDRVELRAREIISEADRWLKAEAERRERLLVAEAEGWLRGGEPGA